MSQSKSINIEVSNHKSGLCITGVPFSQGQLHNLEQLAFYNQSKPVDSFARAIGYWPDKSIKWAHIGFYHSEESGQNNTYQLLIEKAHAADEICPALNLSSGLQLQENSRSIHIETSYQCFYIDLENLSLSIETSGGIKRLISNLAGCLSIRSRKKCPAKYEGHTIRTSIDLNSKTCSAVEVELSGTYLHSSANKPLRFKTLVTFYDKKPLIKYQTTLHNPNPARHTGGLWELGEESSEEITAYKLEIHHDRKDIAYRVTPASQRALISTNASIKQYASGGANWRSPNHADKKNSVPWRSNGYKIVSEKAVIDEGMRATPIIYFNKAAVTVERFWQNFPKAIEINNDYLSIDLFPSLDNINQELQGGEKKTHTLWLTLDSDTFPLEWVHNPASARPDSNWLIHSPQGSSYQFTPAQSGSQLDELIWNGLEHANNFFNKRESIDEYGWRHFGDLYADHETAGYTGDELFASHYNNQYDPIYGFLRQFLLSGDQRWFELADDLAQHVKDIDIYHTEDDKAEYNGGLFWHTDHYLKAYNSTHRSYSSLQAQHVYEDRAGGGGPGGQHCYTTGLTLHYWLTGNESSKEAVLTLANWISHFYEGTGTCLEFIQSFKTRHTPGLKDHLNGSYPLDRGTANYIIALLDSYQLTHEIHYLHRVEHIIQHTVHPADNIELRDLGNVEMCWFYTVFLQALCRYLLVKEAEAALDQNYYYARDTLLHYADWMLACETPYLDKPEILEFPNDTWVAQDLRKATILAAAASYTTTSPRQYLEKALLFQRYVANALSTSNEKTYTRILALLMQNHGLVDFYLNGGKSSDPKPRQYNWPKAQCNQTPALGKAVTIEFMKRLIKLSPGNEIDWLKKRLRG